MNTNFVDKYFQMEREHNLFSLSDSNGLPIWDIVRFDVYLHYAFATSTNNVKRSTLIKLTAAFVGFFRIIASLVHLFFVKRDVLIVEHPRYKKGSYYFDGAIQDFINAEKKNFVALSSYKAFQKFDHYIEYDLIAIYTKLFSKNNYLSYEIIESIQSALSSFGLQPISEQDINYLYNSFLAEQKYYYWYLRIKNPKRIIVNRDSTKKGLIAAAHMLNIPIFETQHGMFTKNHLVYSYPYDIELDNDNIIVPTALFTFDNYWGSDIRVPFKIVPTGNSYFSLDKTIKREIDANVSRNKILVISSKVHAQYLTELLSVFLKNDSKQTEVIFKLHPNEFSIKQYYEQYFAEYPNVNVVADEAKISELLIGTKLVVLINSTVFYESLNYGIPVAVFKRMNYDSYISFFNCPSVFPFDSASELMAITTMTLPSESMSFFKPFDKDAYYYEVKKYSVSSGVY